VGNLIKGTIHIQNEQTMVKYNNKKITNELDNLVEDEEKDKLPFETVNIQTPTINILKCNDEKDSNAINKSLNEVEKNDAEKEECIKNSASSDKNNPD